MNDHLGKYEIRAILGKGAMGTVYEGWDPMISRRVAVKTVRLPDAADIDAQEELARFKREAQAAGRLNHPNIVGVFDYGETDEIAYIVMEFVDGHTLKSLLDKGDRMALAQVSSVMTDLLAGLRYSHERGVIHRDIKPANVMITGGDSHGAGQAKIADFGIARIESSNMTQAGTIMGTPAYMSPEQFMGQTVDARTDIYSSGVLLFQLLTGDRPFEGSMATIMHKALNTVPPRPSELSVTAPVNLDAVVARAMARRPEDRYATAGAFAEAMQAALAAPPGSVVDNDPLGGLGDLPGGDATVVAAPPSKKAPVPPAALAADKPGVDKPGAEKPGATTKAAAKPAAGGAAEKEKSGSKVPIIAAAAVVVLALGGGGAWFALSGGRDTKVADAGTPAADTRPVIAAPPPNTQGLLPPADAPPVAQVSPPVSPPPSNVPVVPTPTTPRVATPPAANPPPTVAQVTPPVSQPPRPSLPPITTGQVSAPPIYTPPVTAPSYTPPVTAPSYTPPPAVPPSSTPPPVATPPVYTAPPVSPPVVATPVAPPVVVPPPVEPPPPPSVVANVAMTPEALRRAISSAVASADCAIVGGDVSRPSNTVQLRGVVGSGQPEQSLQGAVRDAAPTATVDFGVGAAQGPYCGVLNLVRPYARPFGIGSGGVQIGLQGDRTSLLADDHVVMRAVLPEFPAQLQLDYYSNDGSVAHVRKSAVGVANYGAGTVQQFDGGEASEPFGTDVVVAIASSAPLFAKDQVLSEKADDYVRELRSALDAAAAKRVRLSAAVLMVRTSPRR